MTHQSKVNDILWYIDNFVYENDKIRIMGWMFHTKEKITDIQINDKNVNFNKHNRSDVKKYYSLDYGNVGFEITIDKDLIKEPLKVYTDSNEYEIESLEKFFIYYSGYKNLNKNLIIVDDFYKNPYELRDFVIRNLEFKESNYHKGKRSEKFIIDGTKEKLEQIIGRKILNWDNPNYANGVFQYCVASDPIVYHVDTQQYAAVIFLTPEAPLSSGTSTYKSKITNKFKFNDIQYNEDYIKTFKGVSENLNFYDNTSLELVDRVGNVFNRLVIWDAKTIHAANNYFGDNINNSRFFHLFFFDLE